MHHPLMIWTLQKNSNQRFLLVVDPSFFFNDIKKHPIGCKYHIGAGEENRTLTVSLEG